MGDTTFPFRFRCQRSGNCCARPEGVVHVSPADVARIAAHLGMSEAAFRSRYVATSGDRLVEGLGPRCVFLEDGAHATCSIYPARPERCRSWPFWDEHRDPAALAEAVRLCPGIARYEINTHSRENAGTIREPIRAKAGQSSSPGPSK